MSPTIIMPEGVRPGKQKVEKTTELPRKSVEAMRRDAALDRESVQASKRLGTRKDFAGVFLSTHLRIYASTHPRLIPSGPLAFAIYELRCTIRQKSASIGVHLRFRYLSVLRVSVPG
jgi:hypothetical protein